jgi:hypothetical protein
MPDSLFTGVRIRNTILIAHRGSAETTIWSGWRNRWSSDAREYLFGKLRYAKLNRPLTVAAWPFLGSEALGAWIERRLDTGESLSQDVSTNRRRETELRYKQVAGYYVSMWPNEKLGDPPSMDADGDPIPQTKVGSLWMTSEATLDRAFVIGVGKWFFTWWAIYGDDFDVTKGVITSFPVDMAKLPATVTESIDSELPDLLQTLSANVTYKGYKYQGRQGARIANYYVPAARPHTDVIDRAFALSSADEEAWWAVNVCHAHLSRLGIDTEE